MWPTARAAPAGRRHPCAAPIDRVAEVLHAIVSDNRALDRFAPGGLTLWLPGGANAPGPSPAALATTGPEDGAPVLAEAGFGIQLPSWWQAGRPWSSPPA